MLLRGLLRNSQSSTKKAIRFAMPQAIQPMDLTLRSIVDTSLTTTMLEKFPKFKSG